MIMYNVVLLNKIFIIFLIRDILIYTIASKIQTVLV